jgi:hypothetical protein
MSWHHVCKVSQYGKNSTYLDGAPAMTSKERRQRIKNMIQKFRKTPKIKRILLEDELLSKIRQIRSTPLIDDFKIINNKNGSWTVDFWIKQGKRQGSYDLNNC